ncbi:RDD family protein [Ancylobacter sp. 6x-1]|uniref:RDD family protein n=1 Tax=Ancylobacter crimeensis TaxID=2579147 RepID=A0ABT0D6W0_9HYPH|nr:RDD family protein [Ancylobacter crimeensis]MCK0195687.1 RDD family protein [Ancylobacter crimeensis]
MYDSRDYDSRASGSRSYGGGEPAGSAPYVYDPRVQPEYFHGVLSRRLLAFLVDLVIIGAPIVAASVLIFILGFITFGLGWHLFALLSPAFLLWGLIYTGLTLGGPHGATIGMRMVGLEMRCMDGAPMTALLAVMSVVLYWVSVTMLSPLVVLVPLFNRRRRMLHDFIIGTVVINAEGRAEALRRYR